MRNVASSKIGIAKTESTLIQRSSQLQLTSCRNVGPHDVMLPYSLIQHDGTILVVPSLRYPGRCQPDPAVRDDLLHDQASVDWPVAQFPFLESRINAWVQFNLEMAIEDPDPNGPNNVILVVEKEPFPLSFNVEVGWIRTHDKTELAQGSASAPHYTCLHGNGR